MSTKLGRLTELAKEESKRQFFSIAHLITPEALYAAFRSPPMALADVISGVYLLLFAVRSEVTT